jgi:hypothetical protein
MRLAQQFWKIFIGSLLLAWVAAAFFPAVFNIFEGFILTIKPEFLPGSEELAQMDLATSSLASYIAFWAFVLVFGFGIIFGIVITCYEWFKYKRFPLFLDDKVDRLKRDIDKRFQQIDRDISDIKKATKVKKR